MKIWKYTIRPTFGTSSTTKLLMPTNAKVISAQMQDGLICIWATVELPAPLSERTFMLATTGDEIKEPGKFIATVQVEWWVVHIFEQPQASANSIRVLDDVNLSDVKIRVLTWKNGARLARLRIYEPADFADLDAVITIEFDTLDYVGEWIWFGETPATVDSVGMANVSFSDALGLKKREQGVYPVPVLKVRNEVWELVDAG